MLVVVDTNIFINAIFSDRFPDAERILELEEDEKIQFCFSTVSKNELYRIVARQIDEHNIFECSEFFEIIAGIIERSLFISNPKKLQQLSTDKGDQPFIELAVHVNAQFLITDDYSNSLLELGKYGSVNIVSSSQFIRLYNKLARTRTGTGR